VPGINTALTCRYNPACTKPGGPAGCWGATGCQYWTPPTPTYPSPSPYPSIEYYDYYDYYYNDYYAGGPSYHNVAGVTCPFVAAMLKEGDLKLDENDLISKSQMTRAMQRIGVDKWMIEATVDDNFHSHKCPTCPERMNVWRMNTVSGRMDSPKNGPHEHFRSTGIRDQENGQPDEDAYHRGKRHCNVGDRWFLEDAMCFARLWDLEEGQPTGESPFPSNDIAENARPHGCGPRDSGPEKCASALYESIYNLFVLFSDHHGSISEEDWSALWIGSSTYPSHFERGNPRSLEKPGDFGSLFRRLRL
jgi:hypothetical protein